MSFRCRQATYFLLYYVLGCACYLLVFTDEILTEGGGTHPKVEESMNEQRLTLTVQEAADLLGISRGLAYEKCRGGEIPSIRIGRRLLVPRVALERMLEECGAGKEPNQMADE